jgi:hypothetical protein
MLHLTRPKASKAAVDACLRQQDGADGKSAHKSLAQIMVATYLSHEKPAQTIITRDVLIDEIHSQTVAGSFNAGTIASVTLFHVLANEDIRSRLLGELKTIQNNLTHSEAERLPYLVRIQRIARIAGPQAPAHESSVRMRQRGPETGLRTDRAAATGGA